MRHRFSHSTSPLRNLQVILLTTGLAQLGSNVAVLDSGATACTVKSEGGVVGLTPSQSVFTGFDQSGRHLVGDADGRIHLFAYEPNSPSSGAGTSSAAAAFLAAARGFLANCCSACLRALWSTADALTGSLSVHPGLLYELGIFSPALSGGSSPEFLGADHTATLDFRWLSGGLFPVLLSSSPCWSTTDACSASCVHPRHLLPALSGGSTPEFLGAGPSATLDFRWLYSGLFLALLLALRARTAAITLR